MHSKALNVGIYEWHTINAWACHQINKQGGPGVFGIIGLVKAQFYCILKTQGPKFFWACIVTLYKFQPFGPV